MYYAALLIVMSMVGQQPQITMQMMDSGYACKVSAQAIREMAGNNKVSVRCVGLKDPSDADIKAGD